MQDDPVRVQRGPGIKSLRFSPGEEPLDVVRCDLPRIRGRSHIIAEELQNVFVFLRGLRFAEGPYVFEEPGERAFEQERAFVFVKKRDFDLGFARSEF